MKPLVSAVITTYNYGHFLAQAIESVLGQTYKNIELIIVNDGSTDNTDEVVRIYLSDSRVSYLKQANLGQSRAKNAGIEKARGDYVAFLDGDDQWLPEKLALQLPLFGKDPSIGVVYSRMRCINEDGSPRKANLLKPCSGWVTDKLIIDNFVPFSSSVVKRECFDKCAAMDEGLIASVDWDLWLRLSRGYKFDYVNRPLVCYRVGHRGQMSGNQELRIAQSDLIMNRFISSNPGAVSGKALKKARCYTYRNRARFYRSKDKQKALGFYVRSLREDPFQPALCLEMGKFLLLNRGRF